MYEWEGDISIIIRYTSMAKSNGNKKQKDYVNEMATETKIFSKKEAGKIQCYKRYRYIGELKLHVPYILTELEKSILYFQEY